jgi:hypothetical protein
MKPRSARRREIASPAAVLSQRGEKHAIWTGRHGTTKIDCLPQTSQQATPTGTELPSPRVTESYQSPSSEAVAALA